MDTVYGTKKYFQSLSGASDIYRSPTIAACRTMSNDFTYQNTLGRRSTLGAYYHMNKQPSFTNDHSLNSQYGYSTWGVWRDGRNLAPSSFSVKPYHHYQKTKSFSIILTTAAFIILLAVITIAGLAFYFSSVKPGSEEPIIGFEGSFRIAKGDLFSTGLKFNHTSSYKQKVEFYKRFVERALSDTGLYALRTDVWGFGEGPLIKVFFRTFLDVRKLPQNIHSVEDYIKEALILETTSFKSLYRSLKIDKDSVDIKRILDEKIVKAASVYKESVATPTSQTQLEKRLMKKTGTPITTPKPLTNLNKSKVRAHSVDEEPDVDVENAPVIQGSFEGSFEVTKTDADIARRRTTPFKQQHIAYSSSLPPKTVTPYSLRVKPRKPGIEKLTTIIPQQATGTTTVKMTTAKPTITINSTSNPPFRSTTIFTSNGSTSISPATTSTTSTTTTTTSTTTTTTTTEAPRTTSTTETTSTTSSTTPKTSKVPSTSTVLSMDTTNLISNDYYVYPSLTSTTLTSFNIPQMETNLFTSIPILDTQPWKPIHREVPEFLPGPPPTYPTKSLISTTSMEAARPTGNNISPQQRHDEIELPFLPDEPQPPKMSLYDAYSSTFLDNHRKLQQAKPTIKDLMFYHNYGNPIFMDGTEGIERLGVGASIQPHPLPVPLIDEVVVPPFKPLTSDVQQSDSLFFPIDEENDKFEHLGGGVIAKKQENISSVTSTTLKAMNKVSEPVLTTFVPLSMSSNTKDINKSDLMENTITTSTDNSIVGDILNITVPQSTDLKESLEEFFWGLLNLTTKESNITLEVPLEARTESELDSSTLYAPNNNFNNTFNINSIKTLTDKPNFLNLKELILKKSQTVQKKEDEKKQQQQQQNDQIITESTITLNSQASATSSSIAATTMLSTTNIPNKTTTKRIKIKPTYNKTSTILDDSNLFPSHSKWEFVNSSANTDYEHNGNMRKIFNNTLQAWVSVDVDKSENLTLNVIKSKINNATNIQDISLIFDTLASKLGITPSIATKEPPFSHNKLIQTLKNEISTKANHTRTTTTTQKSPTSATYRTTSTSSKPLIPNSTTVQTTSAIPITTTTQRSTTSTSTLKYEEVFYKEKREPDYIQPFVDLREDTSSEGIGAAIPVVGEAEVEVIDPMKYEEMLKSSQFAEQSTTEILPKLVTLLPVRSNSGIRTYKLPTNISNLARSSLDVDIITRKDTNSSNRRSSNRKTYSGQERRLPPSETVIRGGFKVKARYE